MTKANIYESLGVVPIINAAGTFTELGGSLMLPEVIAAWNDAARHFVDMNELQERIGKSIADMLRVEAAIVTGGAASGILLGTAAAVSQRNADFLQRHVVSADGQPYEVLRQQAHTDVYDRQIATCGVRIVAVDSEADVHRLVSDRTVLMMAYNVYEPEGPISHERWLQLAADHSIPTLLDAAADTPPVENLWRYTDLGFDMVAFSGGKAICGPQSTGLLVGRRPMIEAAKRNASPNEGTIGRVAKVSKEDMVALWKSIQLYVSSGDLIRSRCERQLREIETILKDTIEVKIQYITPPVANRTPHLLLKWDESTLGLTRDQLASKLRAGSPPIATARVHGTGTEGLLLSAINLQAGEERVIGRRIREIFHEVSK